MPIIPRQKHSYFTRRLTKKAFIPASSTVNGQSTHGADEIVLGNIEKRRQVDIFGEDSILTIRNVANLARGFTANVKDLIEGQQVIEDLNNGEYLLA